MKVIVGLFCSILLLLTTSANADTSQEITNLQTNWAKATYTVEGKAQKQAFEALIQQADAIVESSPDVAALLIWRGIINSTYAGVKGGLGAMKYAKASKADLEKALKLDESALDGSAYISLGILYFKVPGWPIGFGDNDKAKELLQKGLALNQDGVDSNYFYADFLTGQGMHKEAEQYLLKAQQAPKRVGRAIADKGRQEEILALLTTVQEKLDAKTSQKLF